MTKHLLQPYAIPFVHVVLFYLEKKTGIFVFTLFFPFSLFSSSLNRLRHEADERLQRAKLTRNAKEREELLNESLQVNHYQHLTQSALILVNFLLSFIVYNSYFWNSSLLAVICPNCCRPSWLQSGKNLWGIWVLALLSWCRPARPCMRPSRRPPWTRKLPLLCPPGYKHRNN